MEHKVSIPYAEDIAIRPYIKVVKSSSPTQILFP